MSETLMPQDQQSQETGGTQPDFFANHCGTLVVTDHLAARDKAMAQVEKNAGELFAASARRFVVRYLLSHGASSGEDITDACKSAGIVPHDDRAFGSVYHALARKSVIEKAGYCERRKGNGTAGGIMWRLADVTA